MSEVDNKLPIALPPGIFRNGTQYQAKGRWYDAHLVRFFEGTIRPVGGWAVMKDASGVDFTLGTGLPRGAHAWRANDSTTWFAVGTVGLDGGANQTKAKALTGQTITDITLGGGSPQVQCTQNGVNAGRAYGQQLFGLGLYGDPGSGAVLTDCDVWSFDNFGEELLAVSTCDGRLMRWDKNIANDLAVVAGAPTGNKGIVVTPERFAFVLGAGGVYRRVQWPDQESLTVWTETSTNQAGSWDLQTSGKILNGKRTTTETLIWTDIDLHVATYVGPPFVYRFDPKCHNCGAIGPHAMTVLGDKAYWMSHDSFYVWDGRVIPIPSEVSDYVFGDIARVQRCKVFAWAVPAFNEVWWFYPSRDVLDKENDRYVVYNTVERHWTVGRFGRAAGAGTTVTLSPILATKGGKLFQHETGEDRDTEVPYVESGPIEIGQGERYIDVQKIIPDEKTVGDATVTFFIKNTPSTSTTETTKGPFSLAQETSARFQARQVRMRIAQNIETGWRVGVFRLEFVLGDRR